MSTTATAVIPAPTVVDLTTPPVRTNRDAIQHLISTEFSLDTPPAVMVKTMPDEMLEAWKSFGSDEQKAAAAAQLAWRDKPASSKPKANRPPAKKAAASKVGASTNAQTLLEKAAGIRASEFGQLAFSQLPDWAQDLLTRDPEVIKRDMLSATSKAVEKLETLQRKLVESKPIRDKARAMLQTADRLRAGDNGEEAFDKLPEWAQKVMEADPDTFHGGMLKSLGTAIGLLRGKIDQLDPAAKLGIATAPVEVKGRKGTSPTKSKAKQRGVNEYEARMKTGNRGKQYPEANAAFKKGKK